MLNPFFSVAVNPEIPSSTMGVLFSGHSQTEPQHEVGPQILDHYLIHYVISGKGSFHSHDRVYHLKAGDSFTIFPGELVSYRSDSIEPWRYRWIAFTGSESEHILAQVGITAHTPIARAKDTGAMKTLFKQTQLILKKGEQHCDLRASGYLRLIFASYHDPLHVETSKSKQSGLQLQIEKAMRWLSLQYARSISIEEMAHSLGYHRTHLSKMFKEHTGLAPSQYLLKIRMERAAQLLHNKQLSIQHIASSVGMSDALYFSRRFKQWYGMSPSRYREELQAEKKTP